MHCLARTPRSLCRLITIILALLWPSPAQALELTNGLMYAVPTPGDKAPVLDGTDTGWDLSGAEPVWYSTQLAKQMHGTLALNYDDANLYVYARISLPGRALKNANGPSDPFWQGDMLELRLSSDPSLARPLSRQNPTIANSPRICHMSIWKDTDDGKNYLSIQYGDTGGSGQGHAFNPPGSQVTVIEGTNEYSIQAKIPWTAMNVPDGKNPFDPNHRMTAIFGLHWFNSSVSTHFSGISAVYASDPGDIAFMNWQTWGEVAFSPTGNLKPRHATMEELLAQAVVTPVGVPITIDVPEDGKISVNILGNQGDILRELTGGQEVKTGKFTTYWDGKDQWGFALPPGDYKWGAYVSHGLKARYVGYVGSSGNPPYPTEDGKGGWGGDHGVPVGVAADASGIYFGWRQAEAQRQIVKVDYAGNTLWRKAPFVLGGFPLLTALTSNSKYLFAVYDGTHPVLTRLDAITGVTVAYGNEVGKGASISIATSNTPIKAPAGSLPAEGGVNGMERKQQPNEGTAPECVGVAATDKEVFASVYSLNQIQVLDAETGQPIRTLSCPAPRGLALDGKSNLYAVSYGTDQTPQIVRFDGLQGDAKPVITGGLVAPYGVTVDAKGKICVTDEGASQQVKIFSPEGKLLNALGKEGGRPWAGTYDPTSYRDPSAIVADPQGGVDIAESSIPKIFDRIDIATGKTLNRWFGYPAYGVSNIGDSDDPMTSYFPYEPEGFARAIVPAEGQTGYPNAYWVPGQMLSTNSVGSPGLGDPAAFMEAINQTYGYSMLPYVSRLDNGRKYFIDDGNPHLVSLIEGDNLLPVGYLDVRDTDDRRQPPVAASAISMWIDQDGTHVPKADQVVVITKADGKPLPNTAQWACSMWIAPNGDAYLMTKDNSILKIPSDGFTDAGAIKWNPDKATLVVTTVLPSKLDHLFIGPCTGMVGVRADKKGNVYTCLSTEIPALTPALAAEIQKRTPDLPQSQWCVYANDKLAMKMHQGLGHTAESNAVKFVKFGPDGKMLWIAGRKATANPGPGEMYHFWAMAGMVDDNYLAGASEWGPIYFYTSDGYYVDSIMNDPAALGPAGPYTFWSETFSGRIETYDKLGKVYAYDQGGIYAIDGFGKDLKVNGEQRLTGTVKLDKTYESAEPSALAAGLQIVPLSGDSSQEATWSSAPKVNLTLGTAPLATVQVGYDDANLYARFHVTDDTPLQNEADDFNTVFKGGDVVGLDLGPAGDRSNPVLGDIRILAANIRGQPHLMAMKPVSNQAKQPQQYSTPSGGAKSFDFVGDLPGGKATLTADADGKGYTALLTIPKSVLEFPIAPGTSLKGDVEILLSGVKSQGVQTVSRNWLYSGGHVQTTMVDDIPTEAWLYPQFWGDIGIK